MEHEHISLRVNGKPEGHSARVDSNGPLKVEHGMDRDAISMARAGKKQVLKRNWGLTSMVGFSCALMCTWEGTLVAFTLGFTNGGPAGLIYGLLVVFAGMMSVFITMGELSSMITTAGGQYYWVSVLAPKSIRKFASYITGWLTVVGWIGGVTAASFFVSGLILELIAVNNDFTPKGWHATLFCWAVLLIGYTINTILSGALPVIEILVLLLHILGFFAILIPLVYLSPRNNAEYVFTTFNNGGNWSSAGVAFMIGLNGNLSAFVGTDGAIHMSEEVKDASRNVPKALVISIAVNGVLAFAMLVAILFCVTDVDVVGSSSYPVVPILQQTLQSNAGATVLVSVILLLQFFAAVGGIASASRMLWSFARDHGVPGWRTLGQVDRRTTIPLAAVTTIVICCALLSLIAIGSSTALGAVISLVLEALFISYLLALSLLLWRRLRGDIHTSDVADSDEVSTRRLVWGPWRVKGIWGTLNNAFACGFLLVMCTFCFFPQHVNPTPEKMNWSSAVNGGVVIFAVIYYFVWARREYKGPIVEVVT